MGWEPGPECSGERNAVLPNLHEGCPSEKKVCSKCFVFGLCDFNLIADAPNMMFFK